jgi:hypothetical protein
MMRQHVLCAGIAAVMLVVGVAKADVYTWTDESGMVNVSNLTPPEGAHIAKVVHESPRTIPTPPAPPPDAAPSIEVQTLALRVRQLEYEVELARRQPPPPPMDFAAYSAGPMQYSPPPMQYSMEPTQDPGYGCDQAWNGCFGTWGLGYPATVVVLGAPGFRRPGPIHRPHPFAMQRTMGPPVRGGTTGAPWGGGTTGAPWGGRTMHPPGSVATMHPPAGGAARRG